MAQLLAKGLIVAMEKHTWTFNSYLKWVAARQIQQRMLSEIILSFSQTSIWPPSSHFSLISFNCANTPLALYSRLLAQINCYPVVISKKLTRWTDGWVTEVRWQHNSEIDIQYLWQCFSFITALLNQMERESAPLLAGQTDTWVSVREHVSVSPTRPLWWLLNERWVPGLKLAAACVTLWVACCMSILICYPQNFDLKVSRLPPCFCERKMKKR